MSKAPLLICGLVAAAIGGLWYWALSEDETVASMPTSESKIQDTQNSTIASEWQWNNFAASKADKSSPASAVPSEVVEIYRILRSIKLDETGRVVPDQTLKEALEEGFTALGPDLSAKEMSELQNSVRVGLPGQAGDRAAQILGSYYQFRLAESEFNRSTESKSSAADRHKELVQLRRDFLGEEIADKLFEVEETQARHMFASIAIQQNPNLTAEEKQAKHAEDAAAEKVRRLRDQGASSGEIYSARKSMLGEERATELAEGDREEAQWQSSFNGFWQARRYVMQASLEDAERVRQIEQLLDRYFSAEERERARLTSIDWEARASK
jgi:lipase chaperone LimK